MLSSRPVRENAPASPAFEDVLRLERIGEPAVLGQWLAEVERRLEAGEAGLLRRRADLRRALGDLDGARGDYAVLAKEADGADDPTPGRALAILSGEGLGWADGAGPVPFVRAEAFLDAAQEERLWRAVAAPGASFGQARVGVSQGEAVDPSARQAELLQGGRQVGDWFLPLVESWVEGRGVLDRLGVAPFAAGRRELQVTRHDDGGFYRVHRDLGPNNPLRRLTYVYYFHRRPRRFEGGDLLLFDQTAQGERAGPAAFTRIAPVHNSLIAFPSDRLHAVTRVDGGGSDPLDGRWTVNGWLNARPQDDS